MCVDYVEGAVLKSAEIVDIADVKINILGARRFGQILGDRNEICR